MKKKYVMSTLAALMAATMAAGTVVAYAYTLQTADLDDADIIDQDETGSVTIYKYDLTASGEDIDDYDAGTGEADSSIEDTFGDYAMQGVVFSYYKVGDIEQYSITADGKTTVEVVYEIDDTLRQILGLDTVTDTDGDDTNNAVDMTASGIATANQCNKTGVYHYTSEQINTALSSISSSITKKNALEEYVIANGTAMDETDADGYSYVDGLEVGLYLFAETEVPENVIESVYPFFVSIPMAKSDGSQWFYDITVYPKNETGDPTLDKLVANAEGSLTEDTTGASADADLASLTEGTDAVVYNENDADLTGSDSMTNYLAARTDEFDYADTTTASAGDVLDYAIVTKLPKITSEATYLTDLEWTDTLDFGVTYGDTVYMIFYEDAADAAVNDMSKAALIWSSDGDYFTVSTDTTSSASTMTIKVTADGLAVINPSSDPDTDGYGLSEYYVVVYYQATVDSDSDVVLGDTGMNNTVELTWKRTNTDYSNTIEDEATVTTYGIDLTKTFSNSTGDPTDVQFVLYNTSDGYYVVADVNSDGTYYVTGKTTDKDDATTFSPNSSGKLIINGLEADTYALTETQTSSGFSLLDDQIIIVVSETEYEITAGYALSTQADGRTSSVDLVYNETNSASATVDDVDAEMAEYTSGNSVASENAYVVLSILNTAAFTLPITGGTGLFLITVIGCVALAACFFLKKDKKTVA